MHLTCPHCQSAVAAVDSDAEDLLCPSCGASFRRDPLTTANWSAPEQLKLGRFNLLEEVGRGGFGTVYKAWDPELARTVAVKVPRAARLVSKEDLDRFLREARLAAQLQHPAIVPIFEVGHHDGLPFLVCEFVEGTTLSEYMTAKRPEMRQAAELTASVADALQYAHERGVVHRDVKPSNLMVVAGGGLGSTIRSHASGTAQQASGSGKSETAIKDQKSGTSQHESSSHSSLTSRSGSLTVRLMDFGLAKREAIDVTVTTAGEILGTPAYMSPEQARESHGVDGRSDVYSLGVILYQMLTGELPFRGAPRMLLQQVLHDDPRLLRSLNDRVPRDLETICLKAMAKEPARRYPTAAAFAEDLRRFLRGDPILARPVGRAEKLWRWCRRNPALATASVLTMAALLAVAIVSAVFAVRESRHAHDLAAALSTSEEHRKKAAYLLAESYLERGIHLCEQGEHSRGMLWLARGLEIVPADAADLEHALRANLADWSGRSASLRGVFRYPGGIALQVLGPDARTVFVVNDAGHAELWDAAVGKRIAELDRDQQEILAAFSSEGRTVVTVRKADGAGKIWDTVTGRSIGAPLPAHGPVKVAALSPGGKQALTLGADNTVRIWDGISAKPNLEIRPHVGPVAVAAISPDGKTILTASGKEARLWNAASGQPIGSALQHDQPIAAMAFSGDGLFVATGGWDRIAQIWSADTGQPVGVRVTHRKAVEIVALSPDGSTAFFGGDSSGQLWDVAAGMPKGSLLAHRNRMLTAAFSSDGQTLLTGGLDASARLWDVATAKPRGAALQCPGTVSVVAFSLQGGSFATECRHDGELRFWEMDHGPPAAMRLAVSDKLHAMNFHRDAAVVFTGSGRANAGEARLWDLASGKPLGEALAHPAAVRAVSVSPDGSILLTGCDDGVVRLWDAATSRPLGATVRHAQAVRGVAFSADGKSFFTCSSDKTAQRWDLATRQAAGPAWRHPGQVLALAPSLDGRLLLTGGSDSVGRLWSLTGAPDQHLFEHHDWVISVAMSRDGKIALTGSDDTVARLWDTATGKAMRLPLVHRDAVCAVTFSPNNNFAATGCEDKTARRWDIATGRAIGPPLPHADFVIGLAFRADGKTLVTGCADNTVQVWKLPVPATGSSEQISRWVQAITGQELDAAGAARLLDAAEWHERQR
ncbi:MAG: protein kinase [Gemmataceae bacterium]|nr:protein kinase [Gemmataceae bacterium]